MSTIDDERLITQGRKAVNDPTVPEDRQYVVNYICARKSDPVEVNSIRKKYPSITDEEIASGQAVKPVPMYLFQLKPEEVHVEQKEEVEDPKPVKKKSKKPHTSRK